MKNQKLQEVVVTISFLAVLTLLSKHPLEFALLFGSASFLRWQAGGITLRGCRKNLMAYTLFWIMGMISYPFVCPVWVLFPCLFLINTIIYFFAPATNQAPIIEQNSESEEQPLQKEQLSIRQQKKNRALFITGIFSIATIFTHGTPISSLLLVTLLAQMISILSVIWQALQQEPWEL